MWHTSSVSYMYSGLCLISLLVPHLEPELLLAESVLLLSELEDAESDSEYFDGFNLVIFFFPRLFRHIPILIPTVGAGAQRGNIHQGTVDIRFCKYDPQKTLLGVPTE